MGMRRGYRIATAAAGALALTLGCPFLPAAHAADTVIGQDQMNALCAAQYRGANTPITTARPTSPLLAMTHRGDANRSQDPWRRRPVELRYRSRGVLQHRPRRGVPNLVNPGSANGWVCRSSPAHRLT